MDWQFGEAAGLWDWVGVKIRMDGASVAKFIDEGVHCVM